MKYTPSLYADAFLDLWEKTHERDKKTLCARFAHVLRKHGNAKHAAWIVETIEKKLTVKHGGRMIRLEFARTPSESALRAAAGFLSKKDFVKIAIDPALKAGIRITLNEEQELDYSLERKLKQMFAHI